MSLNFDNIINPIPGLASGTAKPGRFIYVNVGNKIVKCRAGNEILTKKVTVVRNESGEYIAFSEVGNRTLAKRVNEFLKTRNTPTITAIGFPIKILFSILKNGIYYFYIGGDRPEPELVYELDSKNDEIRIWSAYLSNIGDGLNDWSLFLKWEDFTIQDTAIWDDGYVQSENTIFVLHKSPNHETLNNHHSYFYIEPKGFGVALSDFPYWAKLEINFYNTSSNDRLTTLFTSNTQGTEQGNFEWYLPVELFETPTDPYIPVLPDITFNQAANINLDYCLDVFNLFCNDNLTLQTLINPSLESFRWDKENKEYDWILNPDSLGRINPDDSFITGLSRFPVSQIRTTNYDLQNYRLNFYGNFQVGGGNFYTIRNEIICLGTSSSQNATDMIFSLAPIFANESNYSPFYFINKEGVLTENKVSIEGVDARFRNTATRQLLFIGDSALISKRQFTEYRFIDQSLVSEYSFNGVTNTISVVRRLSDRNESASFGVNYLSRDLSRLNDIQGTFVALNSENSWISLEQSVDSYVQFINNTSAVNSVNNVTTYILHTNNTAKSIDWSNFPYVNNTPTNNEFIEFGGLIPDLLINYTTLLNNSIYRLDFDTDLMIDDKTIAIETYTINNDGTITNGITQVSALSLKVTEDDLPNTLWWSSSYYS